MMLVVEMMFVLGLTQWFNNSAVLNSNLGKLMSI